MSQNTECTQISVVKVHRHNLHQCHNEHDLLSHWIELVFENITHYSLQQDFFKTNALLNFAPIHER